LYLGGLISAECCNDKDIQRRIGCTSQAFGIINRIMEMQRINKETKLKIYETVIQPIFLRRRRSVP